MGNSTGNADKKNYKNRPKWYNKGKILDYVETKTNTQNKKNNNTTSGNKPESPGERRKIKEISTKGKTIQTKQHSKTKKKFYHKCEEMTRKYINHRMQEKLNVFGLNYGNQENNEKAQWLSNFTKELEGHEEQPESRNIHRFIQNNIKRYQIVKFLAMMKYVDSGSRNSIHSR